MTRLADAGKTVLLETSGAVDTAAVDPRVRVILDLKTPGSGEVEANVWSNLDRLKPTDEVKFVLCDRADFDWAVDVVRDHRLTDRCPVLFSAVLRPGQPDRARRLDPRIPPARSGSSSSSTRSSGTRRRVGFEQPTLVKSGDQLQRGAVAQSIHVEIAVDREEPLRTESASADTTREASARSMGRSSISSSAQTFDQFRLT